MVSRRFVCVAAVLFAGGAARAGEPDCTAEFERRLAADMSLNYAAFDQTQGAGFRRLSTLGCFKEAADLIEAYIDATGAPQRSLVWHIAQLRAAQGDYASAIDFARRSLNPDEDLDVRPLRWNDYVLAVIAFLERDKAALVKHRDAVAAGVDAYFGNGMNLKILDSLIENFDLSYRAATGQ